MEKKLSNIEPQTLAASLYTVREQIAFLKEQEEELEENLLANLKEQGVKFVRLDDGTTFTRSHRETLKIKAGAEDTAFKWAADNTCLKVDTTKAMKILRRELKMPKFFTRVIGDDYLTVKRGAEDEE